VKLFIHGTRVYPPGVNNKTHAITNLFPCCRKKSHGNNLVFRSSEFLCSLQWTKRAGNKKNNYDKEY
jgi:hypothetical protein